MRVNTEHQEAMLSFSFGIGTLASIKENLFFTPLFSLILNFLQLINIKNHNLLSSSHHQLNILPGEKNEQPPQKKQTILVSVPKTLFIL